MILYYSQRHLSSPFILIYINRLQLLNKSASLLLLISLQEIADAPLVIAFALPFELAASFAQMLLQGSGVIGH